MEKKLLIVGGGVAGLAAGIFGARAGVACTVFEKNPVAGGNLAAWSRGGYTIDNCLHWLTGTCEDSELYPMWRDLGVLGDGVSLVRPPTLYTSEYAGESVTFHRDDARAEEEMLALSPEDGREIRRFFAAVRATKACMRPHPSARERAAYLAAMASYGRVGAEEYALRFRHPLLRRAMCDYIGGRYAAAALVYAYATFASGNGDIPVGGSAACARRMAERFRSLGGCLRTGEEVVRVIVRDRRAVGVRCASGEEIFADAVLLANEPACAFGNLLAREFQPGRVTRAYRAAPPLSCLHIAFALPQSPDLPRGTTAFEAPETSFADHSRARMVLREYSYDPTSAPAGEVVAQSLTFLSGESAAAWIDLYRRPDEYRAAKRAFADEMTVRLRSRLPASDARVLDVWTPATYRRYTGAPNGAFLSYLLTPRTAFVRVPPRVGGVRGLYLAGQWTRAPGGLPVAAASGRRAIAACLSDD